MVIPHSPDGDGTRDPLAKLLQGVAVAAVAAGGGTTCVLADGEVFCCSEICFLDAADVATFVFGLEMGKLPNFWHSMFFVFGYNLF